MFSYMKGILVSTQPASIILEVNGIGYQIFIPCRALGELPQIGEQALIYTAFVVREFSHALYGFLSHTERDIFEIMLNITGIGPKLALSLIGHLSMQDLQMAISNQDFLTLCKVPGVGKKTAERLCVELKDKFSQFVSETMNELSISFEKDPKTLLIQDAILALINLGYHQNVAQKAIKQCLKEIPEINNLAVLITSTLRYI
ncbi:MAG: Holliday junction branch migration protein RuvA [Parachlamydiaceae bacterium]|nr:Holliday junction branch migration protein RuvA [Parachlamydiaceae bacterium]